MDGVGAGALGEKPRRFNQLRREIDGLTQKMLSQTLKALERDGMISRTVMPTAPIRSNTRSRRSAGRSRRFLTGSSFGRATTSPTSLPPNSFMTRAAEVSRRLSPFKNLAHPVP